METGTTHEPIARRLLGRPALVAWLVAFAGCMPVRAEVGAGLPPTSDGADAGYSFFTHFASNDLLWDTRSQPRGSADFGVSDPGALDGKVAELRFPGQAGLSATDRVGPPFATEIGATGLFHFGSYRTSLTIPRCAVGEDAVSAMFVFFNDGSDTNRNGIVDNDEIDVQFLCANPSAIYLTIWTDFQGCDAGPCAFVRLRRVIDFATGDIYEAASDTAEVYAKTGNDPRFWRADFPDSSTFFETGFDWHADTVRFVIVLGGAELTLWTVTDVSHIPQSTVRVLYNVWHPESHWPPIRGPAVYPAEDIVLSVDWLGYRAE